MLPDTMRSLFFSRRIRYGAIGLAATFLLALAAIVPAPAQNAPVALPATSTNDVADVSQFPSLNQLPGKPPPQVWNGLARVWARRHAYWKTNAASDTGAVVFLGDSITEGWSTLAADFPNLKVANRGIGGDITSGVLYRLQADVLSLKPAVSSCSSARTTSATTRTPRTWRTTSRRSWRPSKSSTPISRSSFAKPCPGPTATRRLTRRKFKSSIPS